MVSIGFRDKWTGSQQVSPKNVGTDGEEEDEFDKRSISNKLTNILPTDEKTENIHFSFFNKDLQQIILKFKTHAVITIQRFFRTHLLHRRNKRFKSLIRSPLLSLASHFFTELKVFQFLLQKSAKRIQKAWKSHQLFSKSLKNSPLRKLLAHTVSVGSKLRRIQSMISTVSTNRTITSPESQSAKTPDKKKSSLLFNRRSTLTFHKRTSSLPDVLKDILNDESENLSNDTIPEIPVSAFDSIPEIKAQESRSFLMRKQSFKVRTRKVRKMNLEELTRALAVDEFRLGVKGNREEGKSSIPRIDRQSRFWDCVEQGEMRIKLEQEYMRIMKGIESN